MKNIKRIIGLLLSISMLLLSVSGAAAAESGSIVLNDMDFDIQSGTVFVTGKVLSGMGERNVSILAVNAGTDLSQLNRESIAALQNAAEVKTNYFGNFSYQFEVNYSGDADTEKIDVYARLKNTDDIVKKSLEFSGEGFWEILKNNSLVFNHKNKNIYRNGERALTDNAPYCYGGSAYVDIKTVSEYLGAKASVFEDKFTLITNEHKISGSVGDEKIITDDISYTFMPPVKNDGSVYIDINVFKTIGKNVYTGEKVFIIGDVELGASPDIFESIFGIYVSPYGDDSADGTASNPVKSANRAVALSDNRKSFDGCHIYVEEGEYFNTINIENKKDITIESYANGKAVISGGISLNSGDFSAVTDNETLKRFGSEARGKLLQLDLSKYINVKNIRSMIYKDNYYRLYNDGNLQTLARYPNAEYATLRAVNKENPEEGFTIEGTDRAKSWQNVSDMYMSGFVSAPYNMHKINIASLDNNSGVMSIEKSYLDINGISAIMCNIPEELDIPGEWYIDSESGILYYYPTDNMGQMVLTAEENTLVNIKSSENININNIEVCLGNGKGIYAQSCKNLTIDNIRLYSTGETGVTMNGCTDSIIKNSEIFDIVRGGVYINGGEVLTLTPGNSGAENCHIYDFADENTYMAGVTLEGMGNFAKNNTIHDSMSQGVYIIGNGHHVENNEVYDVVRDTYDAGAIYGIVAKENIGNKILNNYIHDIKKSYRNWGKIHGIYMDNMSSGVEFSNNIISDCISGGLYGGGRNNIINNNIFLDCKIEYDNRGVFGGWFRVNNAHWDLPITSEEGYDAELWYNTYPYWRDIVESTAKEKAWFDDPSNNPKYDAGIPRDSVIENNITIQLERDFDSDYFNDLNPVKTWWGIAANPEYNTSYVNKLRISREDYPKYASSFADIENRDFNQVQGSKIFEDLPGFEMIDFNAIGNTSRVYSGLQCPRLRSPYNSQKTGRSLTFVWEETTGASEYTLKISKNADMSEPVYEEIVNTNTKSVELDGGGRYYYTVTARNISKLYKCESTSEIGTFTSDSEISLESVNIGEVKDGVKAVSFVYGLSGDAPEGVCVLAEKDSNGKLINLKISEITKGDDGKITVSADVSEESIAECYLWEDLKNQNPYCIKASTKQ